VARSARRDELALWSEARKRGRKSTPEDPATPYTVHDLSTGETYLVEQPSLFDLDSEESAS
jgi:hypothetical protein